MTNYPLLISQPNSNTVKKEVPYTRFLKKLALLSFTGALYFTPIACNANENQTLGKMIVSSTPGYVVRVTNTPYTEAYIWQNDVLFRSYAQNQLRLTIPIADNGAMGDNRTAPNKVQVGLQRQAIDLIDIGISTGNRSFISKGLSAYKWAFDRQAANGTFGESQYAEIVTFLGSYARAVLLLRQSGYNSDADILAQYIPKMTKSINSQFILTGEEQFKRNEPRQQNTNQLFWSAFSYKVIHLVQSNPRLDNQAQEWLNTGLTRQRVDGVFPEKNGSDTSYHSWSLELLSLYCLYSPENKDLINPYQIKGFRWLTSKILPDGTMDVSQNTRTGKNQEVDQNGDFKQGKYGRPTAYLYWSFLGGGQAARDTAIKLDNAR